MTPVTAEISGWLTCTPPQIVWILNNPEELPLEQRIRVSDETQSFDQGNLMLTCEHDWIRATVESAAGDSVVCVELTRFPAELVSGSHRLNVQGRIDNELAFQIPILIVIASPETPRRS